MIEVSDTMCKIYSSIIHNRLHHSGNENFCKFCLIYGNENQIFQWLTFLGDSNDDVWIGWEDKKQEGKKDRKSITECTQTIIKVSETYFWQIKMEPNKQWKS